MSDRLSALERLPDIVLRLLCHLLAPVDDTRQGLRAFSLVSVACARAAETFRLERVCLRLKDGSQLSDGIVKLMEVYGQGRLAYIRQMAIARAADQRLRNRRDESTWMRRRDWNDFCETPTDQDDAVSFNPFPSRVGVDKYALNDAWMPLARLIGQLPCLTDFVYAHSDQIPPCVLSALHCHHAQHHRLRVHVHTFSLRSLYVPVDGNAHAIDANEWALVTSPCLHCIAAKTSSYDGTGFVGYNNEAIALMVQGLAPGLRSVVVRSQPLGDTPRLRRDAARPKPPWEGFGRAIENEQEVLGKGKKGQLEALVLDHWNMVQSWPTRTDLSMLRTLMIGGNLEMIRDLMAIAQDPGLTALRNLDLDMGFCPVPDEGATAMDEAVASLLEALPSSLRNLRLEGFLGERTWRAILDSHGQTLEVVRFMPCSDLDLGSEEEPRFALTAALAGLLGAQCPCLEVLETVMPRTAGDKNEIAIYLAFGRVPLLRELHLHLDCEPHFRSMAPDEQDGGEISVEVGAMQLAAPWFRDTLVNAAVDETLARTIFDYACGGSRLKKLELRTRFRHPALVSDCEVLDALNYIGRSRNVSRDGKAVNAQSFGREDEPYLLIEDFFDRDDMRRVWESIWPGASGDRKRQWSSIPLRE